VCNLTNKKGHTSNWSVEDYVESLEAYIGKGRVDYVIVNVEKPKKDLIQKYERKEGKGTLVKREKIGVSRKYKIVNAYVISEISPKIQKGDNISELRAFIRHDSDKLAQAIMLLLEMEGQKVIEEVI
jgi:2-phospho-L-lactate transferase/gluconeogenesis factor (CofD/UPF0052 family)